MKKTGNKRRERTRRTAKKTQASQRSPLADEKPRPAKSERPAKADPNKEISSNAQRRGKPAGTKSELEAKLARVKRQLEEMRDYKRILSESGLKPDEQDKFKESGLIKNLLSLEKQLGIEPKKKKKKFKTAGKRSDKKKKRY